LGWEPAALRLGSSAGYDRSDSSFDFVQGVVPDRRLEMVVGSLEEEALECASGVRARRPNREGHDASVNVKRPGPGERGILAPVNLEAAVAEVGRLTERSGRRLPELYQALRELRCLRGGQRPTWVRPSGENV
jgi:hypothetical protein